MDNSKELLSEEILNKFSQSQNETKNKLKEIKDNF